MYAAALFVSWVRHGRSERLAELLGADAAFVTFGRSGDVKTVPVRYARQAVDTVRLLRRTRPDVVIVMGPPLASVVLCRLAHRGTLVFDAHTGAVLRDGRVRPVFRVLARLVDVIVVHNESLADRLLDLGIRAIPIHDPVAPSAGARDATQPRATPTVVFPAGWRPDEPIDAVFGAARLLPDVDVVVTGRPPAELARSAPTNVRLPGYVDDAAYDALLRDADVVLALTTRQQTMQRAGYEALELGCPLVASDTDVLRELFTGGAVFAAPTATSLAAAITEALDRREVLAKEMRALREERVVADARAVAVLQEAIGRC